MPNDFSAFSQEQVDKGANRALAEYVPRFSLVTDMISLEKGVTSWKAPQSFMSRIWTPENASATPELKNIFSAAAAATPIPYHFGAGVTFTEMAKFGVDIEDHAYQAARGFMETIDAAFGQVVVGAEALTHPMGDSGKVVATGGAPTYFADAFTLPVVQKNAHSLLLSSTGIEEMYASRETYADPAGNLLGPPDTKGTLFCVPEARSSAHSLLNRKGELVVPNHDTDTVIQNGSFDRYLNPDPMVLRGDATTANNIWGIIWSKLLSIGGKTMKLAPIVPVVSKAFSVEVRKGITANSWYVMGHGLWTIALMPSEADLQISTP